MCRVHQRHVSLFPSLASRDMLLMLSSFLPQVSRGSRPAGNTGDVQRLPGHKLPPGTPRLFTPLIIVLLAALHVSSRLLLHHLLVHVQPLICSCSSILFFYYVCYFLRLGW